ncbi:MULTISPECIES: carbon dioxide-concentrating mechanism protein CcmK [Acaryochloris]|uniref:Carboxysome shell protein CcmK n=1 Tax=Acaryochloris marina (strain MBIC 11017) TaxID=329726 RepID=B0CE70_ACAM1|nr:MULTISPECIES: carbon dioxide-concentrating mechanism protein CcmK [Acaryochloris]ABW25704.1 carbon dioxide concentrating mechanism protein CcmK, putative [Acaryochloris marina MBIC11017]KAI9130549.1 carbon dioxide-concentrating mechanism protein CcmK [Acaryochloris sp. CCMEE 5410]BDM80576.1 carbon dioxide-concentrating protein CcmK [Acaryochloris marina MBIC10699]
MPVAVGMIETYGYPAVLAAADAMVKAGRVALMGYTSCASGRYVISIRGPVAEVKRGMEAGIAAVEGMPGSAKVESHYIVPNPPENIEAILPIDYSERSEPFRT